MEIVEKNGTSCRRLHSIPENQHITSHVTTIFCNHLAKLLRKIVASQKPTCHMLLLSFVSSCKVNAPQTKILDCRTNVWERNFEVLFKGVSTRFGLRSFKKYFENAFPNVRSDFQNLRLGSIKLLQKIVASQKIQHITCCYYLLWSSCKVVTKDSSIQENPTHVATIFCDHLAKLLQKIVASQKSQYVTCC